jgi:amino acid adenylation domain-containing protein
MNQSFSDFNRCVSVIIPAYNSAKFVAEAIESAIDQTYPDVEVIVVDDGSTDETKAICDRYPTVKYIYQPNQGVSIARNNGMNASQGAYLVFLDSDDRLLQNAVEVGVNCLNTHPEAGFVFGSHLFKAINPDGSYTTRKLFDESTAIASYQTILAAQHQIQCAAVLFRRTAIESVGGFDPSLARMEDLNLFLRIAREFSINFHQQIVCEYRYHGSNVSSQSAKMLIGALHSQRLEWDYIQQTGNLENLAAYYCGRQAWIKFFGERLPYEIMRCAHAGRWIEALGNLRLLINYDPQLASVDREIYAAAAQALHSRLQELPIESSLAYWRQQLDGAPRLLSLPTECRSRSARTNYSSSSPPFAIAPELNSFSQQQGVTIDVMLLAAVNVLLYRYTNTVDILVGMPSVQQIDGETLVNPVVIRTDLAGKPSFPALLAQVQQVTLLAQRHQSVPFELLVAELQPQRDVSYHPLFQVALVYEADVAFQQIDPACLTASDWTIGDRLAKFDLTLVVKSTSNGLIGNWVYDPDLFDAATIDRFSGHFQTLLSGIVANRDRSIAELPLLTDLERSQLLGADRLQIEYPQTKCLHQLFADRVALTPKAIAVTFEDQQLTYQELNDRANQLAHYLIDAGVTNNTLVGLCVDRSFETIVGILGILKAGGAYVPLDPSTPPERVAFILADAQINILVTQSTLLDRLSGGERVICLDRDRDEIDRQPKHQLADRVPSDNLAYMIYTSGSTGQPKGVLVNHHQVVRLFAATDADYQFSDRDVWTLFHSYAFDFSVWEIWGALLHGGRLVVVPYLVSRDPSAFYDLLVAEGVTILNQTPSAFTQLIKVDERKYLSHKLNLRSIVFGGEALNLASLQPWFDRHGDTSPQLVNMYGITETTVHVTYRPLTIADVQANGSIIGRPLPDLQIYLLDAELQPVPIGVSGEMYVGGAGVSQGYWQRAELTRERFIPNPFSDRADARLYKTGDLARYLADGNLEYLGRIDNQVKIRGFRIELGEIESVLSQHPQVSQAVTIVRDTEQGVNLIVAYCVADRQRIAASELRGFLAQRLPDYMLPTTIEIIETLPLTTNGKIDRAALLAYESNLAPVEQNHPPVKSAIAAPVGDPGATAGNSIEATLIEIWAAVLGQPQIGIDDNFFDLGGNSISILQVADSIRSRLNGVEISVVKLFQYSTIAKLAEHLRGSPQTESLRDKLQSRAQRQKASADARRRRS